VKERNSSPFIMEPSLSWRKAVPMQIYSVVNVKNLKLFEPPMIMDQNEEVSIPLVNEFAPKYLDELQEYIILDKRTRTSRRGDVDYL
jgi:hypothetical protein